MDQSDVELVPDVNNVITVTLYQRASISGRARSACAPASKSLPSVRQIGGQNNSSEKDRGSRRSTNSNESKILMRVMELLSDHQ
mmetsp:Transcript_1997/g.5273  ORF Transcript_1997/g.5273 Transcript_1997/m.5273 type:complete len:84 (+) Transcript_1997:1878-2129(+)